jgi:hypothetical protein
VLIVVDVLRMTHYFEDEGGSLNRANILAMHRLTKGS